MTTVCDSICYLLVGRGGHALIPDITFIAANRVNPSKPRASR